MDGTSPSGAAHTARTTPRLAIAGALLVAALLLGFPAPARADEPVLVSNFEESDNTEFTVNTLQFAQGFITDDDEDGYLLGSIFLHLSFALNTDTADVTASLLADDGSGKPGSLVCMLEVPDSGSGKLGSGERRFAAPAGCGSLSRNAHYFVFLNYADSSNNPFRVRLTNSDDNDANYGDWSIDDRYYFRHKTGSNTNWQTSITDRAARIQVRAPNTPPTVAGDTSIDYAENGEDAVATYTANDPDEADQITWSVSGDDSDDFSISGEGALSFNSPPDFESPADNDGDNDYEVTVVANDGSDGDATGVLAVIVRVTNVSEAPAPTVAGLAAIND